MIIIKTIFIMNTMIFVLLTAIFTPEKIIRGKTDITPTIKPLFLNGFAHMYETPAVVSITTAMDK